jgi:hypothetical protein
MMASVNAKLEWIFTMEDMLRDIPRMSNGK